MAYLISTITKAKLKKGDLQPDRVTHSDSEAVDSSDETDYYAPAVELLALIFDELSDYRID